MYTTGIPACDQLMSVKFTGNIIPQIWYSVFVKKELKHPKPFLLAIIVLADIVYWYRPKEVRDEQTGRILGYKKRFSKDMLQRSYSQISEQFGCSTGQAKEAIVYLEQYGVIERVFREMTINGIRCNNILFINLNVARLQELTYPYDENHTEGVCGDSTGEMPENLQSSVEISPEPVQEFTRTNTENISTYISTEITPSIYLPDVAKATVKDGLSESEEKYREYIRDEIHRNGCILHTYKDDEHIMQIAIRLLTDWYYITPEHFVTAFEYEVYVLAVECLVDMACADDIRSYRGMKVTYARVIERINEIITRDKSLYSAVVEAIDDYIKKASEDEIKDKSKYMMSVLWNSLSTYMVKQESYFSRTFGCDFIMSK